MFQSNTLSNADSGRVAATLNKEFDVQKITHQLFTVVADRIKDADHFGRALIKNKVCLILNDDSEIRQHSAAIEISLAKKTKSWLDEEYLNQFKNLLSKDQLKNLKKVSKQITFLTINGTVAEEIVKIKKKVLPNLVHLGLIIPIELGGQSCRLIGAEEFVELVQQKQ